MANVSEAYILRIRTALRIKHTYLDAEVADMIEAERADLVLAGILPDKVNDENDPLIRRAIRTYCKANFGLDNPDSEDYAKSYEAIKLHLQLSNEYKREDVV